MFQIISIYLTFVMLKEHSFTNDVTCRHRHHRRRHYNRHGIANWLGTRGISCNCNRNRGCVRKTFPIENRLRRYILP